MTVGFGMQVVESHYTHNSLNNRVTYFERCWVRFQYSLGPLGPWRERVVHANTKVAVSLSDGPEKNEINNMRYQIR